jgi:uncharacterized protein YaiL (DUF2058 family)
MKTLIAVAIITLSMSVYAQDKKTQAVDAAQLKSLLSSERLSGKDMDNAYNSLDKLITKKINAADMKTLLELCLLYFKHDQSDAAYDFVYNLKKSDETSFNNALNQLPKEDQKKIKEFIELSEREAEEGNG